MSDIRSYIVSQTRKVTVTVVPREGESYEQAALRVAHAAFQNPGEPEQGMQAGVSGMPEIVTTTIHKDAFGQKD
jgi:hypothetical protein